MAPRMHCGMKHVTIVEIHMLILNVSVCVKLTGVLAVESEEF